MWKLKRLPCEGIIHLQMLNMVQMKVLARLY